MNIEIGKYVLKSDQFCMWIEEAYKTKKGETGYRRVTGYVTTPQRLLESFRDTKVKGSDAETVEKLLDVLRAAFDSMLELDRVMTEQNFALVKKVAS